MNNKEDFFDRLFHKWPFRIFESFYQKNREVLLYLFFGGLTFLVSIGSYTFFYVGLHINELIANVFSWVLAVLFAYITNRIWVFQSRIKSKKGIVREMGFFFGGRVLTLIIEEAILFIFITNLHWNGVLVKIAAQIVVILLNYIISKLLVFRKKKDMNKQ